MASSIGGLEPVGLDRLAMHLRDADWIDMQVVPLDGDAKVIERVRVEAMIVFRDRDEVMVTQKYGVGDTLFDEKLTFDCEEIRWVRPTQVELLDVVPPARPLMPLDATYESRVLAAICDVLSQRTGVAPSVILAGDSTERTALYERQQAMWALWEMTNLSPEIICTRHFKYQSNTPLMSVKATVEGHWRNPDTYSTNFVRWTKDMVEKVDVLLGAYYRRSPDNRGRWPSVFHPPSVPVVRPQSPILSLLREPREPLPLTTPPAESKATTAAQGQTEVP